MFDDDDTYIDGNVSRAVLALILALFVLNVGIGVAIGAALFG